MFHRDLHVPFTITNQSFHSPLAKNSVLAAQHTDNGRMECNEECNEERTVDGVAEEAGD